MGTQKKKGAPPRYDEAFRAGAIRLVTEQGRSSAAVAAELGICIDTLRSWLKSAGVRGPARRIGTTATRAASESWRRRFARCASR